MKHLIYHEKITLRPLEPEDIELLYQWENNMGIWEISNTRAPFSRYILAEYIKNSVKDIYETKQLRLMIENERKRPVGAVDLFDFDPFHLRAGVGILIHRQEDRGQSYATDTLKALCEYTLNTLGLKQLYASIAEDNLPSIGLFEKAGFKKEGIKKCWLKTTEGWKNELFLQKMLA